MHNERCMSGSARGRAKPLVARPEWRACPTQPYIWTLEGWLYLAARLTGALTMQALANCHHIP